MTDHSRPPDPPPPRDLDVGTPLALESTARSRSWLWSAAALLGVLIVVVAVGRLGQTATNLPGSTPRATAHPTLAAFVPGRSPAVVRRPVGASSAGLPGPVVGIRVEGDRYNDGIPAVLDGDPVVRVRDTILLPEGSVVLVGGWTHRTICTGGVTGPGVCPLTLSDVPFGSTRVDALALVGKAVFEFVEGPRVFQATIQGDSNCDPDSCLPRLSVGDALWTGDSSTSTSPIDAAAALAELSAQFPKLDFTPFEEATSCPVRWPIQSYVVSVPDVPRAQWPGLPIRLVMLYPSVDDLTADSPASRSASAAITPFDASNRCVSIPGGVDDSAWVVRDNAMVLLGPDDPGVRAQVTHALDHAIATD